MATLVLEPGPMTGWELKVDDLEDTGLLAPEDVGEWLDRLIRSAHRGGRKLVVQVVTPAQGAGFGTRLAARMIDRVLEIYDAVEVERR